MAMDLGTAVAYLDLDLTAFNQGIESVNSAISGLQGSLSGGNLSLTGALDSVGSLATNVGGALTKSVTAPIVEFGQSAIQAGMDFDAGMSKVKSIVEYSADFTEEKFQQMRDLAIEMGAKTKFSATEAAEAMVYMGMAGWDASEIIAGLPGVMDLAAASGESLGTVSDIVTDSLTAFGMTADDTQRYVDLLAQTARASNTNVSLLGQSFKYAAPLAGTLGYSAEDVALALGLMANSGIKASQAGTTLRGALSALANPSDKAKIMMDELGISLVNTDGELYTMQELMVLLRDRFHGLSDAQQVQAASAIFGRTAMSGMLAVINSSQKDFDDLTEALNNSKDAAHDMATTMLDNLAGSIVILKSTMESLFIKISDIVTPVLSQMVEKIQKVVEWFVNLDDEVARQILKYAALAAAAGPVLMIFGKLITSVSGIIKMFTTLGSIALPVITGIGSIAGTVIKTILSGIGGLFTPFKSLIGLVGNLFNAFKSGKSILDIAKISFDSVGSVLNTVRNSTGLMTAAIALLVAGFVKAYKESDSFRNALKKLFDIVLDAGKTVWEFFKTVWAAFKPAIDIVVDLIAKLLEILLPPLVDIIGSIMKLLESLLPVFEFLAEIIGVVAEIIAGALTPVLEVLAAMFGAVIEAISWAIDKITEFIDWIKDLLKPITDFFGKVKDTINDFFGWTKGEMKKSGQAAVDGFSAGIESSTKKGLESVKTFGKGIADSFKSVLEIHSPSGLFKRFGNYTVDGYVGGVQEREPSARNTMSSLGSGIFQSFNDSAQDKMSRLLPMVSTVFQNLGTTLNNTAISLRHTGSNMFEGFFSAIQSTWNNINRWVSNAAQSILNVVSNVFNAVRRIGGSHANGLDFVPYDGYIAELHQGERVLTKAENKEYEAGLSGNGGQSGDTFNFYNTKPDPYEYARQMKRAKRELEFDH